jgi:hypothetical protein
MPFARLQRQSRDGSRVTMVVANADYFLRHRVRNILDVRCGESGVSGKFDLAVCSGVMHYFTDNEIRGGLPGKGVVAPASSPALLRT